MLASYEITRPDEVELAEEAARLLDLVDEPAKAVGKTGFMGVGSTGQLRVCLCLRLLNRLVRG